MLFPIVDRQDFTSPQAAVQKDFTSPQAAEQFRSGGLTPHLCNRVQRHPEDSKRTSRESATEACEGSQGACTHQQVVQGEDPLVLLD